VNERDAERAESELRRALSTLDDIAVPSLAAVRTGRRAAAWRGPLGAVATMAFVLVAAVAIGQGLALWRADRSSVAATASPAATAEQRYLDIDGYRFTATIVRDARYGPAATAGAAYVSAVPGVGVRCEWTRTGGDLAKVTDLWGTRDNVVSTAASSPVRTGAQGNRTNGVPAAAVQGTGATMTCGLSDDAGGHGIYIDIALDPTGGYRAGTLAVTRWSGVVGDTLAAIACKGKAGTATLIAAFTSTAAEVADWVESVNDPTAPHPVSTVFRTSYSPSAPIYVCYFSGSWAPPVGPPGPGQTERPIDYDRARYFVDDSGAVVGPSTIGSSAPSSYLPLIRPGGGRF